MPSGRVEDFIATSSFEDAAVSRRVQCQPIDLLHATLGTGPGPLPVRALPVRALSFLLCQTTPLIAMKPIRWLAGMSGPVEP
jgi:hypothetical protein